MKTKNVTPIAGRYSLALDRPTDRVLHDVREHDGLGTTDAIRKALKYLLFLYRKTDDGGEFWYHPADGSAPYKIEMVTL